MFEVMKSGAIVCNSGHFDVEINKDELDAVTEETFKVRPFVEGHRTKDGREIFLLADGRLVNLAAAEGHPAAVMDMSFANQALCAEHMVENHASLEKRVYTGARGDRPRDRAVEACLARGRDRRADGDPAEVPGELGPGNLAPA